MINELVVYTVDAYHSACNNTIYATRRIYRQHRFVVSFVDRVHGSLRSFAAAGKCVSRVCTRNGCPIAAEINKQRDRIEIVRPERQEDFVRARGFDCSAGSRGSNWFIGSWSGIFLSRNLDFPTLFQRGGRILVTAANGERRTAKTPPPVSMCPSILDPISV